VSRILIVDDDAGVRELCTLVLGNEGYEVVEAQDAAAGLDLARAQVPDLVLLDWMMPDTDGMDTLVALKKDPATRAIPVVMLTALDGLPQIGLAMHNGADGYVTKPFEVQDLLSLVSRFTAEPASAS